MIDHVDNHDLHSDPLAMMSWADNHDPNYVEEEIFGQAWNEFEPREDKPDRFDQQTSFVNSRDRGIAWLVGGNGSGTTECAVFKACQFMLDTCPPRRDTPFWIIGPDFPTVCALWDEKIEGHGHIPPHMIDRNRIRWWKPNQNMPFSVPLFPREGEHGVNWNIEFKSWGQGRHRFQARAIGGFLFTEQFPYGILQEVKRGIREQMLPGSQICEFTPIDPNISPELDERLENGPEPDDPAPGMNYLPSEDAIYRCNTECAMEAEHVDKTWFRQFFGMISDEMRDTRMTGAFASFEGQIYKGLDPHIHFVGDDVIFPNGTFPEDVYFRRGIDWGSGPENAFCCIFGCKNVKGQWFIFDEYYSNRQLHDDGSPWTSIDHLCAVCDMWPWPQKSPYYGVTYADPAGAADLKIASKLHEYTEGRYPGMSIHRGNNDVHGGIEHVRWLLKQTMFEPGEPGEPIGRQPRIFIHKHNCPNLCRQLRSYRWQKSNPMGLNPRDAKREPLKKNDHAPDALRYLVYTESIRGGITPDSLIRPTMAHANRGVQWQRGNRPGIER